MAKFNILSSIAAKINDTDYFTAAQKRRIVLAVNAFHNVANDLKGFVIQSFEVIASGDSAFKKEAIVEMCEEIAFEQIPVRYFRVSEGASFCVSFTLDEGEDFTGTYLTGRDREDDTLLSTNNQAGDSQVNAPTQDVEFQDLSLTAGSFYPVNCLLESDSSSSTASGDASTLLEKVYFLVTKDIDA